MNKKKYPKYSVLVSVYCKENPKWFEESIESMLNQTVLCDEFVIVEDGPLTDELNDVVSKYIKKYPKLFNVVKIEKNGGLGPALKIGVENCKYEWIARIDSDDISVSDRIEKQFDRIIENPKIDFIGSNHIEFVDDVSNKDSYTYKNLPSICEDIIKYSKKRNPFSHSVMLIKKEALINSGNYREYHLVEDYDMWLRMIRKGYYCENINEYLSYVRVSSDLYKRRGGIKYLKYILKFKKEQYDLKFLSFKDFIISSASSTIVCLMPGWLRQFIYKKMLRK